MNDDIESICSSVKFIGFDFDGVFTDNIVYTSQDGNEYVACWRSDGLGLSKLKKTGIPIWVISTEKNPVVKKRCEKLEINCLQGCDDKLTALERLLKEYDCKLSEAAFVGNDINDVACLENVGLPIVVADAHPDIQHLAKYKTRTLGGKGAVREVCDLISGYHLSDTR